jgi:hypothetical protein
MLNRTALRIKVSFDLTVFSQYESLIIMFCYCKNYQTIYEKK